MQKGDLVKCYNWQFWGELAIILEVKEDDAVVYIFDAAKEKTLPKNLISLFATRRTRKREDLK